MASFLFLVAGVVIGLLAGWLLRGRRTADSQSAPTPAPTTEQAARPAAEAVEAQAAPEPVAAEPVAEAAEPAPEPAAEAEPVVAASPEPAAEPEPVAVVVETPAEDAKPLVTPITEPAAGTTGDPAPVAVAVADADDLTKIAGIGPKAAAALVAAGITTYRQLADTDTPALKAALAAGGVRSAATVATWPEKAKQLAGA